MKTILTGIKPTGDVHLGNYLGAIRPGLKLAHSTKAQSLLFIADYHCLTSMHKASELSQATRHVAASWLACGLNTQKTIIYKQSDVPEIFELSWILSCFTPKGFMNRAHAYKAKQSTNKEDGKADLDSGVNMGLFNYPVLMSADILMFNATDVPVGEDQAQHVEFARDIAQKFNNNYGDTLVLPKPILSGQKLIPGLDGRKMSKSYKNTIPLFCEDKKFRKLIMKIKTDSLPPEAPKDIKNSTIFDLYKEFATDSEVLKLKAHFESGIGWGEAKQVLFEKLQEYFLPHRQKYNELMSHPDELDKILLSGAEKARQLAKPLLKNIKKVIGVG